MIPTPKQTDRDTWIIADQSNNAISEQPTLEMANVFVAGYQAGLLEAMGELFKDLRTTLDPDKEG